MIKLVVDPCCDCACLFTLACMVVDYLTVKLFSRAMGVEFDPQILIVGVTQKKMCVSMRESSYQATFAWILVYTVVGQSRIDVVIESCSLCKLII